jgi:hypothetical protein
MPTRIIREKDGEFYTAEAYGYSRDVIGMICGGLAMWAIAQVLRIELAIFVLENTRL